MSVHFQPRTVQPNVTTSKIVPRFGGAHVLKELKPKEAAAIADKWLAMPSSTQETTLDTFNRKNLERLSSLAQLKKYPMPEAKHADYAGPLFFSVKDDNEPVAVGVRLNLSIAGGSPSIGIVEQLATKPAEQKSMLSFYKAALSTLIEKMRVDKFTQCQTKAYFIAPFVKAEEQAAEGKPIPMKMPKEITEGFTSLGFLPNPSSSHPQFRTFVANFETHIPSLLSTRVSGTHIGTSLALPGSSESPHKSKFSKYLTF